MKQCYHWVIHLILLSSFYIQIIIFHKPLKNLLFNCRFELLYKKLFTFRLNGWIWTTDLSCPRGVTYLTSLHPEMRLWTSTHRSFTVIFWETCRSLVLTVHPTWGRLLSRRYNLLRICLNSYVGIERFELSAPPPLTEYSKPNWAISRYCIPKFMAFSQMFHPQTLFNRVSVLNIMLEPISLNNGINS